MEIQNGVLNLGGGGTDAGIMTVPANAMLTLSGGTFLSSAGSSITGGGQLTVAGAAATFAGLVNLTGTNTFSGGSAEFTGNYFCTNNTLVISGGTADFDGTGVVAPTVLNMIVGGTLGGAQTVTVGNVMNWLEGTMTGGGRTVISPGATLNIPGSDTVYLSSRTVENGGTILWTGPANIYTVDTVITNRAGALFDAENAASFYLVSGGPSRIDNAGTFRKSGAGTTSVGTSIGFNNYNTVNIQTGILSAAGELHLVLERAAQLCHRRHGGRNRIWPAPGWRHGCAGRYVGSDYFQRIYSRHRRLIPGGYRRRAQRRVRGFQLSFQRGQPADEQHSQFCPGRG